MRIAVLADIHGNTIALDAVLADASSLGVDEFWFLGDFAAIGPEPAAVLDRVTRINNARFIRGNTDRYIVTGETPPPSLDAVQADPSLVPIHKAITASFAWTRGYVEATGWFDWLAQLPLDITFTCPDMLRIVGVHAAPGTDDGEGIHPGCSNERIESMLDGTTADLIVVGHTHEAMIRQVDSRLVVNVGSVSNPMAPDLRACYLIIETTGSGTQIVHRRVAYDHRAFIESVRKSRHPATDFILSFQHGERHGHAPHRDHARMPIDEPIPVGASMC